MNTKTIVAGLGATAAIAAGAVHFQATGESPILAAEDYHFMEYVTKHGKSYGTVAEFQFRSKIFKEQLAKIAEHNSMEGQTSTVGVNHLTDRTKSEIKHMLGYKAELKKASNYTLLSTEGLPAEVDWRTMNAVTPAKNQLVCDSGWAFSAVGAIEGALAIKTGQLQSFSEQQVIDCSTQRCMGGGEMDLAYQYIETNPLELESDYPYISKDGKCKFDASKGVGQVGGIANVTPNSPEQLKAAIAKQPVSVAIEANQPAFVGYRDGVITQMCGQQLDHAVLAVGYGTLKGEEYFLVKNSWGEVWAENGYARISTSASNVCGILSNPSYPIE